MDDLLVFLVQQIVDEPDEVTVERFEDDAGRVVLELSVGADDYGHVIGRRGRTANALRTVIKAVSARQGRRVLVDIVD